MHIYMLFLGDELLSPHKTREGAETARRQHREKHGESLAEYRIEGWRLRP